MYIRKKGDENWECEETYVKDEEHYIDKDIAYWKANGFEVKMTEENFCME